MSAKFRLRQNGRSSILQATNLFSIFLLGKIVYTKPLNFLKKGRLRNMLGKTHLLKSPRKVPALSVPTNNGGSSTNTDPEVGCWERRKKGRI
jgi:hypothetical protein